MMVSLTLAFTIGAAVLCIIAWFKWQTHRAEQQAVEFARKNAALAEANEQLQAQKQIAETKVNNYQVRKNNEQDANSATRDAVIERLQQSDDLRD